MPKHSTLPHRTLSQYILPTTLFPSTIPHSISTPHRFRRRTHLLSRMTSYRTSRYICHLIILRFPNFAPRFNHYKTLFTPSSRGNDSFQTGECTHQKSQGCSGGKIFFVDFE